MIMSQKEKENSLTIKFLLSNRG